MSNMKKTNDFFAKIKEAGLEEAFGKMTSIAFETMGCYLEDLIDDSVYQMENPAPDLKEVYLVVWQDGWLFKQGKFWILPNDSAAAEGRSGWVAEHTFLTIEAARAALEKKIRDSKKGPRTETMACGGIGIDLVVDEASAREEEIAHWKIRRQFNSEWEIIESK